MDSRVFRRFVAPLVRRIRMICGRGVVDVINDARLMQELQFRALDREVLDGVEHWQPYGFTYHPLPGGEVLYICPLGDRSHVIAIAVADRKFRPKNSEPGEVVIYDDLGKSIRMARNGDVHITAPRVLIDANVQINGDVEVDGSLHATGTILDDAGNTPNHAH